MYVYTDTAEQATTEKRLEDKCMALRGEAKSLAIHSALRGGTKITVCVACVELSHR